MNEPKTPGDSDTGAAVGLGQILVIIGLVFIYGVGGYWVIAEIVMDPEAPWWLKIGLPAIIIGLTVLFFTVLKQRIEAAKTDKYIDVED